MSQIQLNGIWFPQDIVNEDKNKVKRFTYENNNYKQNAHILPYCLAASTAHITPPSTKTKNELKSINFSIKCFRPLNYCHCHNYESS